MGRLVGYYQQNRKDSYTPLDIPPSNRNAVVGSNKNVANPFSPVADWMSSIDLFLEDEGQLYGNMEEAASVARIPAACLESWSGDHRQMPGGHQKARSRKPSEETHQTPSCSETTVHSSP